MIKFTGRWLGITGIGERELNALKKPAEVAVLRAALRFEKGIKKTLTGPRSGRIYGTHQASAPGEAPATWSGALRQSITHTMPYWDKNLKVSADVGTNIRYGAILEWGGVAGNGARILPRPYIESTFFAMESELEDILAEAVSSDPTSITTFEGGDE